MNRGEVWWYELADVGRRPGCILTRQAAIPVLNAVLVAPATRTIRGIPTEMRLGPEDGMPDDCALSFETSSPCRRRCSSSTSPPWPPNASTSSARR